MNTINKSKGYQIFNIPNTPEGLAFKKQIGKFLNHKKYRIHSRGRGPRPRYNNYAAHLPIHMADWLAVYISPSEKQLQLQFQLQQRIAELEKTIKRAVQAADDGLEIATKLNQKNDELTQENEDLTMELADADNECNNLKDKITRMQQSPTLIPTIPTTIPVIKQNGKEIVIRINI